MKTQNTKITNIEFCNGKGNFIIDCGRFGLMVFDFDIDFNVDSDCDLESVNVQISAYDWDDDDYTQLKTGMLNKRNTKMICEYLEEIILSNPYDFGFDENDFVEEYEPDFEEYYYGNR